MFPLLEHINTVLFQPCELKLSEIKPETESQDYLAHDFNLQGKAVKFRLSKITPTKSGQFVTIWKRNQKGQTAPFDPGDSIRLLLIASQTKEHLGLFIFPETELIQHGIFSTANKTGKRGIRLYPGWEKAQNKQATKSQTWQLNYFIDLSSKGDIDLARAKHMLSV